MSYELFKSRKVMELHSPSSQFKTHFKGVKLLNFLRYPFLLDVNYLSVRLGLSQKLLQMETRIEHRHSMEKGVRELLQTN